MSDGAVYGDILSAFPELIKEYTLFRMTAQAAAGYNSRTNIRTVYGIFRKVPGGTMAVQGENREPNGVASLYIFSDEEEGIPTQGAYLEVGSVLYILKKDNNYDAEGGYVKYLANIVPGPTYQQKKDTTVMAKAKDALQ